MNTGVVIHFSISSLLSDPEHFDIVFVCLHANYLNKILFKPFQHIGCDYMIDSKAIEDRCGICHGDGSTCTTVKSKYTETQGLGMYFLYRITGYVLSLSYSDFVSK